MGYYTYHELETKKGTSRKKLSEIEDFISKDTNLLQMNSFNENDYVTNLKDEIIGLSDEPCKWYSSHEDMKVLSSAFPDVLFTLSGDGEDSDDIWKTYYLRGKSQYTQARMVFDEFDENKLND